MRTATIGLTTMESSTKAWYKSVRNLSSAPSRNRCHNHIHLRRKWIKCQLSFQFRLSRLKSLKFHCLKIFHPSRMNSTSQKPMITWQIPMPFYDRMQQSHQSYNHSTLYISFSFSSIFSYAFYSVFS